MSSVEQKKLNTLEPVFKQRIAGKILHLIQNIFPKPRRFDFSRSFGCHLKLHDPRLKEADQYQPNKDNCFNQVVDQAYGLIRCLDAVDQRQALQDIRTRVYQDLGYEVFGMELGGSAGSVE